MAPGNGGRHFAGYFRPLATLLQLHLQVQETSGWCFFIHIFSLFPPRPDPPSFLGLDFRMGLHVLYTQQWLDNLEMEQAAEKQRNKALASPYRYRRCESGD